MKNWKALNLSQQELVAENLNLVAKVLHFEIWVNTCVLGISYQDLFQEGCLLLCHAATTYEPGRASFQTFACTVIRNGLLSHVKKLAAQQRHMVTFDGPQSTDGAMDFPESPWQVIWPDHENTVEMRSLLDSMHYQGNAERGINALKLRMAGWAVSDIAAYYGVKANLVGSWVSKAIKKLKADTRFIESI